MGFEFQLTVSAPVQGSFAHDTEASKTIACRAVSPNDGVSGAPN
jgi:hypothetical protein